MKSKGAFLGFFLTLLAGAGCRAAQLFLGLPDESAFGLLAPGALLLGGFLTLLPARREKTVMRLPLHGRVQAGAYLVLGLGVMGLSVVCTGLTRLGQYQTWNALAMLLAILAGLVFFMQGCLFAADGQNFAAQHPKVSLLPVFWCLWNLAVQVRVYVEAFSVQSLLVGVLFLYLSFSFLAFAQMAAGSRAVTRGRLAGWSLAAIASAAAVCVEAVFEGPQALVSAMQPPGSLLAGALCAVFLCVSLSSVRPATKEERVGEREEEEEPSVRPVVMMDPPAMSGPRLHAGRRPVVASREDLHVLTPSEIDLRTERVLVRYLQQAWDAKCYFYRKTRPKVKNP